MDPQSHSIEDILVLVLNGRFDAYKAPSVSAWLENAANQKPAKVIIDLAEVDFMDSSALASLVRGLKRCREHDGDLRLCNLQRPVNIIFQLTRMDKAFKIYADEQQAVASFRN